MTKLCFCWLTPPSTGVSMTRESPKVPHDDEAIPYFSMSGGFERTVVKTGLKKKL